MDLTENQVAALRGLEILYTILLCDKKWSCGYCSASNTILSEICDNCKKEDVEQGG